MTYTSIRKQLIDIYNRSHAPEADDLAWLIAETNDRFMSEAPETRPRDEAGLPGGLICLNRELPCVIVPDIHARLDFIISVLLGEDDEGASALDRLCHGEVQILCLGDGMHSEGRASERWNAAAMEYFGHYREHLNMDEEMRESLGVMEMVMLLKNAFPNNFHFLKGNHENITNEDGNGNHPYAKYALEGEMVSRYMEMFYGPGIIDRYYAFEGNLPVLSVGRSFMASHAEPAACYRRDEVIHYRSNPLVVEGLTWTDNDVAEEGSVACMMAEYLGPDASRGFYFGGHRSAVSLYGTRAGGKYIQINSPDRFIIAKIDQLNDINPDENIVEIENSAPRILSEHRG
ncbi:MAG: metallophosphoesterase [Spirochaetes bacterium]|nr:metallophosphoesterase [Spirochaetota bacterium]